MTIPSARAFLLRYPEFGEQSLSVIEGALAEAGRSTSADKFGVLHTDAVSTLAAHLLAIRTMQIGIQIEVKSGAPAGQGLDTTLYGQEYRRMQGRLALSGFAF